MTQKKKITDQLIALSKHGTFRTLTDSFPGNDVALLTLLLAAKSEGSGKVRMTKISAEMNISKPAATQAVERLCRHGYAEREIGSDRRTVCIGVTEEGEKYYKRRVAELEKMITRIIDTMGEENVDTFFSLFASFSDAIDAAREN